MLYETRSTYRIMLLNITCWYANIPTNEVTSNIADTKLHSKTAREV